jgi:oligoribonuclease NrnB/cAMP/cGMP phosphodiesterase (DHH superfamily)
MGSLSRDERDVHLITRGNVDGIVSAAIFLDVFPNSRVSFVTSPTAGAKVFSKDEFSSRVFLVDLAVVPELARLMEQRRDSQDIFAIDHHQPSFLPESIQDVCMIREGMSAAGAMYRQFRSNGHMRKLVAIADLVEFCNTEVLQDQARTHGIRRIEEEARILDYSWRFNIEDDMFRLHASSHLASGCWPSEVGLIKRRYLQVQNEKRWPRALARVERGARVEGSVCILEFKNKRRSLHGFGTRALVEVAKEHGCSYAVMINERKEHSSVSMRGLCYGGVNLGKFTEEFTSVHGLGGGGHPTSAGARIPTDLTPRFVDEFQTLVAQHEDPRQTE